MTSFYPSQPGRDVEQAAVVVAMDTALCAFQWIHGGMSLSWIVSQKVRTFSWQRFIEPPDGHYLHTPAHPG